MMWFHQVWSYRWSFWSCIFFSLLLFGVLFYFCLSCLCTNCEYFVFVWRTHICPAIFQVASCHSEPHMQSFQLRWVFLKFWYMSGLIITPFLSHTCYVFILKPFLSGTLWKLSANQHQFKTNKHTKKTPTTVSSYYCTWQFLSHSLNCIEP